jgi:phosphodiesterase/alkaline phosphatase D-like protein
MSLQFRISFLCTFVVFLSSSRHAPAAEVTHGIVVGAVTDHSARCWVRLDGPGVVSIEVAGDSMFTGVTHVTTADSARIERNFAVIEDLSGLLPDTRYYCRAIVGGSAQGKAGAFTTFPPVGSTLPFTFGFGSCQQSGGFLPSGTNPGAVFPQILAAHPSFFLQIGDWGYPDTTDALPDDSSFFSGDYSRVQASYLRKYSPDYPMDSLLHTMPVDYVYDDHDFMNDNASALTSSFIVPFKPNQFGNDYVAREIANPPGARENSIRGYTENMPSYALPNPTRGIYHSFVFGNAEFFMLDLRSQRSSNLTPFGVNSQTGKWEFHPGQDHSILGRDSAPGTGESQLAWLLNGLKNSTATWKFLASSVPFNQGFAAAINLAVAFQDVTINDPEYPPGSSLLAAAFELSDKWAGFPADADTLLHVIVTNGITNVIVLSGDSHTAAIDDGTNAGLPEIMAAGLDIRNSQIVKLLTDFGINIWNAGGQGITTQVFNDAFGKVTVFGEDSVRLSLVDEAGVQFASLTVRNQVVSVSPPSRRPSSYRLEQNFPNPFNPSTVIRYFIPENAHVTLMVRNILGEEVSRPVEQYELSGEHYAAVDASALASGVYFYTLRVEGRVVDTKKMIVLR